MKFANPFFLNFLWLLPLPLVIYFLFSRKAQLFRHPPFFILEKVFASRKRIVRLKKFLIFLFRILSLLFLVMSFSSPVIKGRLPFFSLFETTEHSGKLNVVFLVDRSYSMERALYGKALSKISSEMADAILSSLGEEDSAAMIFFGDKIENPSAGFTSDFSLLKGKEKLFIPRYQGTNFKEPLARAYKMLSGKKGRKVIFLMSDMAPAGFDPAGKLDVFSLPNYDSKVYIFAPDFELSDENYYIKEVRRSGKRLIVEVANPSRYKGKIRIKISGKNFYSEKDLIFDGENARSVNFPFSNETSEICGKAEIISDSLAVDNDYYFSFAGAGRRKVLIAYSKPEYMRVGFGGYFLSRFFSESDRYSCSARNIESLSVEEMNLHDIVFALGVSEIQSAKIKRFVSSGNILWLLPDFSAPRKEVKRVYESFKVEIKDFLSGSFVLSPPSGLPFSKGSEILDFEIDKVETKNLAVLSDRSATTASADRSPVSLWTFTDKRRKTDYPAVIYKPYKNGIAVFSSCPMDIDVWNIGVKPFFSFFITKTLDFLVSQRFGTGSRMLNLGEQFKFYRITAGKRIDIFDEKGNKFLVSSESGKFSFFPPTRGLYFWKAGNSKSGCFAVNRVADPKESRLSKFKRKFWQGIDPLNAAEEFKSKTSDVRLTSFFLLLAAVCFIFSAALADAL